VQVESVASSPEPAVRVPQERRQPAAPVSEPVGLPGDLVMIETKSAVVLPPPVAEAAPVRRRAPRPAPVAPTVSAEADSLVQIETRR
jgi:hypothetical protein